MKNKHFIITIVILLGLLALMATACTKEMTIKEEIEEVASIIPGTDGTYILQDGDIITTDLVRGSTSYGATATDNGSEVHVTITANVYNYSAAYAIYLYNPRSTLTMNGNVINPIGAGILNRGTLNYTGTITTKGQGITGDPGHHTNIIGSKIVNTLTNAVENYEGWLYVDGSWIEGLYGLKTGAGQNDIHGSLLKGLYSVYDYTPNDGWSYTKFYDCYFDASDDEAFAAAGTQQTTRAPITFVTKCYSNKPFSDVLPTNVMPWVIINPENYIIKKHLTVPIKLRKL